MLLLFPSSFLFPFEVSESSLAKPNNTVGFFSLCSNTFFGLLEREQNTL